MENTSLFQLIPMIKKTPMVQVFGKCVGESSIEFRRINEH